MIRVEQHTQPEIVRRVLSEYIGAWCRYERMSKWRQRLHDTLFSLLIETKSPVRIGAFWTWKTTITERIINLADDNLLKTLPKHIFFNLHIRRVRIISSIDYCESIPLKELPETKNLEELSFEEILTYYELANKEVTLYKEELNDKRKLVKNRLREGFEYEINPYVFLTPIVERRTQPDLTGIEEKMILPFLSTRKASLFFISRTLSEIIKLKTSAERYSMPGEFKIINTLESSNVV